MDKVLIGAGRHAVEVAHYMAQLSMPLSGFVENNAPIGKTVLALPVHDFEAFCKQAPPCEVMVAIGATARHALIGSLERAGHTFFSLVASGTWVGSDFKIGAGSLVAPGCVITANVSMGRHSILNIACSLSHDVSIGDFTTISPGCRLTGHVKVGDKVFLGTGAIVLPHVTIGDGAVVAAGAVVKKDVPPYALVAGDPARVIKMYAKD